MILISVKRLGMAILAVVLLGACGGGGGARPQVIVSTSILGDMVFRIAGDGFEVVTLIPPGTDPHGFRTSVRKAAAMREASLVVVNGLGLEAGLADVIAAGRADGANLLEVGPLLDPIPQGDALDPHVWLDPARMARAALLIGDALAAAEPDQAAVVLGRAAEYRRQLVAVDTELAAAVASIPASRRLLITNHDSLGYLAAHFGFEVVGTVIPSASTEARPSGADLAELVATIRRTGVRTIFSEASAPDELARAVAAEIGANIQVVALFVDSLGKAGSGAESYIDMMRTDIDRIVTALAG